MQLFTAHRFVAKKLQISGESLRPCGKYFQGNRIYGHQSGCQACTRVQEIRPSQEIGIIR